MNRQQKTEMVELLKNNFMQNQTAFLVGVRGLTVAQTKVLRAELRKSGGKLKISKARLMKRAAQDANISEELLPYFKDQIGLIFMEKEPTSIAKILENFSKENEALQVVAGCIDSNFVDRGTILRLASIPSKEVLLAQVCGTIKAPIVGLVNSLNMLTLKLVWTLKQVSETKK
jgi:large subunit ribosomal protein L10